MMYRIRNWKKFQHYRNRNPPWVKLYGRELVHDREWMSMDFAKRGLLVLLWSLASEKDGGLIPNPKQLKARIESETDREEPMPSYDGLIGRWIEEVAEDGTVFEPDTKEAPTPPPMASTDAPRPGVPACPECGSPLKRQQARPAPKGGLFPPAWWCRTHKGEFRLDDPRIFEKLTYPSQETVRLELQAFAASIPTHPEKPKRRKGGRFDQGFTHEEPLRDWNPPEAPSESPAALALADFLGALKLRKEIHEHSFATWFAVLRPISLEENNTALTVAWPAAQGQQWFARNYMELCRDVAASIGITRFELWTPPTT